MNTRHLFVAAASLIAAAPAHADTPTGVWFLGGSVGEGESAYGGAVVSLPGARLGKGFALRGSAGGGRYEYDAGPTRIKADYASAEVALVYQTSGNWGWNNFSIGPRYTHTSLSPVDPGNDRRGSRWDLGLQVDGALDSARWRLGWFGSVGPFDGAYQARLQLGRKLSAAGPRIGIEGGVQGDPSYTREMLGGFVGVPIAGKFDLQFGAGATKQADRNARAYGSIGLSRVF